MHDVWSRLKSDTQLAVVSTVGVFGIVSVTPFAIYRMWQDNWLVVAVDIILLLTTLIAVAISWRYGSTRLAGQILAAVYGTAAVIVSIHVQAGGLFWFYCLILFNFFVIPPLQSTIATLLALSFLCIYGVMHPGEVFVDLQQMLIFTATCLLCSLFAFTFAWRTGRQRQRLRTLANMDPLTGVGNRRTLTREMEIALASHNRHGTPFGLLLLDLDNFKCINDRQGHVEGDRVLVEFAQLTRNASRRSDRLFRLGGEEFVLLMSNIDQAGLESAANSIVRTISTHLRSAGRPVTVSIGGALLDAGDDSISWLNKADACMYRAKHGGRNRCVVHLADEVSALIG
ncbi:diguanylate cyclase (GGDEF) domain-containing protein [Halopseudomonas litoralis]|uniref:diguanylate cyclase n=1 Tax=Halopseudomonas litoralis TaxID=797277 RepID=A0A1H1RA83_9GAMM|nr:GGDEF domain-containing protein [Halopseudomonas litoralis]SDS32416.1 diguanylate cyclase (GGDEF) domain-containing protein [Halopseudomonas litoralis]